MWPIVLCLAYIPFASCQYTISLEVPQGSFLGDSIEFRCTVNSTTPFASSHGVLTVGHMRPTSSVFTDGDTVTIMRVEWAAKASGSVQSPTAHHASDILAPPVLGGPDRGFPFMNAPDPRVPFVDAPDPRVPYVGAAAREMADLKAPNAEPLAPDVWVLQPPSTNPATLNAAHYVGAVLVDTSHQRLVSFQIKHLAPTDAGTYRCAWSAAVNIRVDARVDLLDAPTQIAALTTTPTPKPTRTARLTTTRTARLTRTATPTMTPTVAARWLARLRARRSSSLWDDDAVAATTRRDFWPYGLRDRGYDDNNWDTGAGKGHNAWDNWGNSENNGENGENNLKDRDTSENNWNNGGVGSSENNGGGDNSEKNGNSNSEMVGANGEYGGVTLGDPTKSRFWWDGRNFVWGRSSTRNPWDPVDEYMPRSTGRMPLYYDQWADSIAGKKPYSSFTFHPYEYYQPASFCVLLLTFHIYTPTYTNMYRYFCPLDMILCNFYNIRGFRTGFMCE